MVPKEPVFPRYLKTDVGQYLPGVRQGVLFRSAWGVDPGLLGAVEDPIVKIDMRGRRHVTPEELALDQSRIVVIPVEQPKTSAVLRDGATREEYTANYVGMLEHCGEALASVIGAIADGIEEGGCVLGCSVGRDRTGMALALVARGLGRSHEEILSGEVGMREELAGLVEVSPHPFEGMTRGQVVDRLRAPHEPVVDTLMVCESRWGSVRSYLGRHGLGEDVWPRLERSLRRSSPAAGP
jgi:hypothetical protein